MSLRFHLSISLVALALVACSKDNPEYCDGHPDDTANCPTDAMTGCTGDGDCSGATSVCETTSGTCVACTSTESSACMGTTPVCSAEHACTGCTSHDECPASNVCLQNGACADADDVAYVSASGTGTTCTQAAPCPLLASAVATGKGTIKIEADGAAKATAPVTIDGKAVTILAAAGATLDRDGDGPILEVKSANANVEIYDLHITGASGAGADGVVLTPNGGAPSLSLVRVKIDGNQGTGVTASGGSLTVSQSTISQNTGAGITASGGTLTVSQSTISANTSAGITASGGTLTVSQSTISQNTGGGIAVDTAAFSIVGNVVFGNGSTTSTKGGISISTTQSTSNRLEFNSVSGNVAQSSVGTGVACIAGTFTARNNVLSDNGTVTNMEQVSGSCSHTYSIVRPGTMPTGAGNSNANPLFVNATTGDLHLQASSPAIGAADPSSILTGVAASDIDGDSRSSPADIGADEYTP